jgi:hypothetical protein
MWPGYGPSSPAASNDSGGQRRLMQVSRFGRQKRHNGLAGGHDIDPGTATSQWLLSSVLGVGHLFHPSTAVEPGSGFGAAIRARQPEATSPAQGAQRVEDHRDVYDLLQ